MYFARRLMVLYICVKFRENISNGIRVMERTQNYEALTDGRALNFGRYNIITRHFLWRGRKKETGEGVGWGMRELKNTET